MPPASPETAPPGFEQLHEYRARLLERLEQQPGEFAAVLAAVPEAEWHQRRDDLGRTVHQVASHVRYLETLAFLPRIRSILTMEEPALPAYRTHHWADEFYDPAEPMAALLTQWSRARAEIIHLLRPQDTTGWSRLGFHPPSGARTLQWWAERTYNHAREHLNTLRQARLPAA